MWYLVPALSVCLVLSSHLIELCSSAPAEALNFRSNAGVTLNARKKVHGDGEKCPSETVHYCKCRARGGGLDITCENVNTDQLDVSKGPFVCSSNPQDTS